VKFCYHPDYQASGLPHFHRLQHTADWVAQQPWAEMVAPHPVSWPLLADLHDETYLQALQTGQGLLAGVSGLPWSEGLVESVRYMCGGQLSAAALALTEGIAFNLACGFHHAHPHMGGGFCVLNGLALVAKQYSSLKIAVLDCDEHGGDGTETFAARLDNLHAFSIFGTRFGCYGGLRSVALPVAVEHADADFRQVLERSLSQLVALAPDLCLYQAGADMHKDDPKASLRLSSETLAWRDQRVFQTLKRAKIPVLCNLAGGYQAPDKVAALYLQTVQQARLVFDHTGP
jgi:acetoin utilization deacetylase AcuC-like enzyme